MWLVWRTGGAVREHVEVIRLMSSGEITDPRSKTVPRNLLFSGLSKSCFQGSVSSVKIKLCYRLLCFYFCGSIYAHLLYAIHIKPNIATRRDTKNAFASNNPLGILH